MARGIAADKLHGANAGDDRVSPATATRHASFATDSGAVFGSNDDIHPMTYIGGAGSDSMDCDRHGGEHKHCSDSAPWRPPGPTLALSVAMRNELHQVRHRG